MNLHKDFDEVKKKKYSEINFHRNLDDSSKLSGSWTILSVFPAFPF